MHVSVAVKCRHWRVIWPTWKLCANIFVKLQSGADSSNNNSSSKQLLGLQATQPSPIPPAPLFPFSQRLREQDILWMLSVLVFVRFLLLLLSVAATLTGSPVSGLVFGWEWAWSWAYCGVWLRKLEVLNNNWMKLELSVPYVCVTPTPHMWALCGCVCVPRRCVPCETVEGG